MQVLQSIVDTDNFDFSRMKERETKKTKKTP